MADKALYYPYIHIQNVDWLRGTLLLFKEVRRMVPAFFTPNDADVVRGFADRGLLAPANLRSNRAKQAQRDLAKKLRSDAENPEFCDNYGSAATYQPRRPGELGFNIHVWKLVPDLRNVLTRSKLAWKPETDELCDENDEYIEVHPRVGQAIMSTLAIACAYSEGLDIVGDNRSTGLHRCLIEKDAKSVYDAWLHPDSASNPASATGEELFEFMIGFECDLSALTPEALASMGADRTPIKKLVSSLREHAARIPAMDPGPDRERYFRDEVSTILEKWRGDRSNMSNYWREFFGAGLADAGAKFVEKIADKAITGTVGGAAGAAAAGTTLIGAATAGLVGAGAGLGVGLIVHAGKSYAGMRKRGRESMYHYLTTMENAGVVFRSELNRPKAGLFSRLFGTGR